MRRDAGLDFLSLSAVPFLWALSNSMIIPVLPDIQVAMDLTRLQAGLIITALSVPAGVLLPLTGYLSDRLGRKAVIVPALLLYGLGGLAAGVAGAVSPRPYTAVLAGRLLQGIGASGTTLLAMAWTADIFQSKERVKALGLLESANSLGKLVAPLLGGAAVLLAWYIPFFIYPLLTVPAAIIILAFTRDPGVRRGRETPGRYFRILSSSLKKRERSFLTSLLAGFTAIFLWFGGLFSLSQALKEEFAAGSLARGLLLSLPVLALAAASVLSGRYRGGKGALVKRVGLGLAGVTVAMAVLPLVGSRLLLAVAMSAVGTGLGIALPPLNTMITSTFPAERRGTATALYGSVRSFGSALGPPVFAFLMELGAWTPFVAAAALSGGVAALSLRWIREEELVPARICARE